jgi:hypothetical protein
MDQRTKGSGMLAAMAAYALWTIATWFFEGRIGTFLRPDAAADRIVYALVVNLLLGIAGGVALVRRLVVRDALQARRCGFGPPGRTAAWTFVGLGLGLASYLAQGAPSTDPVVVANAFSQVFVVSAAEVVVCWALVAATTEAAFRARAGRAAPVAAAVVASGLFGLYHFAHSPPFDTWSMVGLLTVVGLVTSTFFLLSRDVLATAVFHNFLGTYGVTQALVAQGATGPLETLQPHLAGTAALSVVALLAGRAWIQRSSRADR